MNAKFFSILAILISLTYTKSLTHLSASIEDQNRLSSTKTSNAFRTYTDKSGYNTSVQVIDTKKRFDRVRFVPRMFSQWIALYVETQSYDFISTLDKKGYVNNDGSLKHGTESLAIPLKTNAIIQYHIIKAYYEKKYTEKWIYSELESVGVIDKDGFLTHTDTFSDTYNPYDFDQYYADIKHINLNVSNPVIAEALHRELLRMLSEMSLSIHVTQQETTRYQSRKRDFFESLLDQLAGNIVGRLFFPDTVKTVKQKMTYSPNINPKHLFTNIKLGFAKAAYYKGAVGNTVYYGVHEQKSIEYGQGLNQNFDGEFKNKAYRTVSARYLQKTTPPVFSEWMTVSGAQFSFNQLKHSPNTSVQWYSVRAVVGTFSKSTETLFSGGLTLLNNSIKNHSKLGISLAVDGTFHLIPSFGLYYRIDSNFGLNLHPDTSNWGLTTFGLGFKTGIPPIQLKFGYDWVKGIQEWQSLHEGYVAGLTVYF